MVSDIKEVLSMLYDLYKSNMDKKYNEFNDYITDIFDKTKIIEENYTDILSKIKYGVIYEKWNSEIVIKYLSEIEYELKSERVYIRENLKHLNRIYNGELEVFVGAVFNIMYCDYVERFWIGKDLEHRFTGLIKEANRFRYEPLYKEKFIEHINYMLNEVNKSWEIVCAEYFKLKEKYGNKIF